MNYDNQPILDRREGVCRTCGETFIYDADWFRAKNFSMPKHCAECRHRRRLERMQTPAPLPPSG